MEHFAEPAVATDAEEPQPAKADAVLQNIAQYRWKPLVASFPTLADRGPGVEQFRSLRSRIYQTRYEGPLKTILVSSGMPSEGKSFVAANLAMSLARNSVNSILLIDGDLRRPTLHKLLGAPNEPGLSEYLAGYVELNAVLQRDLSHGTDETGGPRGISNLTLISAGRCGDNSSELVSNRRIEELIVNLAPHFDWILIDSPPVLAPPMGCCWSRGEQPRLTTSLSAHRPLSATHASLGLCLTTSSALHAADITTITTGDRKTAPATRGERIAEDRNDQDFQCLLSDPDPGASPL